MSVKNIKNILKKSPNELLKMAIIRIIRAPVFCTILPDSLCLNILYKVKMGKKLNLYKPQTFNEKLQWLKLFDRKPEYTQMVDKYEVRKYIEETIGKEYLIPLIGVWNKFEDIDFDSLPEQFVLKCTHDSGGLVICKDKNKLDIEAARKKINKSLKRNYFYHTREWPYKNVKSRIICEKYMVDESGQELKDYKFMCFNGEPKIIQVMSERMNGNYYINHFDLEWNRVDISRKKIKENTKILKKPEGLEKMIEISKELSKDIPFVRIDLYQTKMGIFFGEITFFPISGYMDFKDDQKDCLLGSWIKLSDEKEKYICN